MLYQTIKITVEIVYFKSKLLSNIKMPRLSQEVRNQAIGMIRAGMTIRGVARILNVNKNTVARLVQRHRVSGSVTDHPRSGRPRVTTAAQDQYLRTRHLRYDFVTYYSEIIQQKVKRVGLNKV